jgi:uncharacterized SAM-binding protein YcdF (DUF218 family)
MLFTKEMDKAIFYISQLRMKILLGLVGLSIALVLFREQWLPLIGDFLFIQDPLHPADVIHVIAGEDYRTDYAIQLYNQGFAKALFFTGGWCDIHFYNHGEHAQAKALAQGVPSNAIAFDDAKVLSTYMEAERLKEWIADNPYPVRSVIVVSDPFHMRRVRWTYRWVLGDSIEVQMAPVPFEQTPYQGRWWTDQKSRQSVQEEYSKLIYYLFRYQFSRGFFRDWLASFDTE